MIAEDLDLCGVGFQIAVWNKERMDIKEIYERTETLKKKKLKQLKKKKPTSHKLCKNRLVWVAVLQKEAQGVGNQFPFFFFFK